MVDKKHVMSVAPVIIGICNWSLLVALVALVEYLPENEIKGYIRAGVYVTFLGAAFLGFLGKKKRGKARLYNDRVCVHDPDSGRDIHYEFIARVHVPNLLVNPWAVLAPMMADIVRLSKKTGSLSCTPKTVSWMRNTDGVRWNLDPKGCNEVITGDAAVHLHSVLKELLSEKNLTQQQKDMKEGLKRMMKNGLKIEPLTM